MIKLQKKIYRIVLGYVAYIPIYQYKGDTFLGIFGVLNLILTIVINAMCFGPNKNLI